MKNKYCISCGKLLKEGENLVHNKCIKKFFSINKIPQIDFKLNEISIQVQKTIGKLSISGIQPKLSLKLNKRTNTLEITNINGEFILKPQTERFPNVPENENLFMTIFEIINIKTAEHTLIELKDNSIAYIVKRFDREKNKKKHFEDFQSILNLSDKYGGSAEAIGKAIKTHAKFPGLELLNFMKILIMNFIIGNGDGHLKNYGFLYNDKGEKILAPCYDIVCSKILITNEEDSAITINGKKNKISLNDFYILAKKFEIDKKSFENILIEIRESKNNIIDFIKDYPYLENKKKDIINIINNGFNIINSSK